MKVTAIVCRHALQAADGHGLAIQASSAAGRLARPVTSAAQYPGKHIRLPVQHVRIRVAALRNQPNIFRNVCMGRASPLAVHNLVEVVGVTDIRPSHKGIVTNLDSVGPRNGYIILVGGGSWPSQLVFHVRTFPANAG